MMARFTDNWVPLVSRYERIQKRRRQVKKILETTGVALVMLGTFGFGMWVCWELAS